MTVLHYLGRDGVALCGAYPRPHLITGDEDDCSECVELHGALHVGPRTRGNRRTPEERSAAARVGARRRRRA